MKGANQPHKVFPGDRFGRLIVLELSHTRNQKRFYLVQCDCGNTAQVQTSHLRSGATKSCGCLKREQSSLNGKSNIVHGQSSPQARTAAYRSWEAMKRRCLSPQDPSYPMYGGRGIGVDSRWEESFEAFFLDMGDRPRGTSLDRIDVNGDYTPENCRWVDASTQGRNKRSNRMVEFRGDVVPLVVVAEKTGVPYQRLHERIVRRGWSVEDAISTPSRAY